MVHPIARRQSHHHYASQSRDDSRVSLGGASIGIHFIIVDAQAIGLASQGSWCAADPAPARPAARGHADRR